MPDSVRWAASNSVHTDGNRHVPGVWRIVKYDKIVVDRRSFPDFPVTPARSLRAIFSRAGFPFDEVSELPEEIAAEWYTAMWSTGHDIRESHTA